ncbi:MAG TPA: TadE/TadG family type IV pilus assembly protein [Rhizomicrobium sp.]|nr:TadE/TadG family type IV pilus assembly protein [Rhizomicrobium sp.]
MRQACFTQFWRSCVRALRSDQRGVAAVEFALIASVLCVTGMNVVDIAMYTYEAMEVETAAHTGAMAGWKACDLSSLPATVNCSGFNSAVTAGIQSTSLGKSVTLTSGSPSEGYYCVNSANALQYMSSVSSKPADCSAAGTPSLSPGDYIKVKAAYTYAPLFSGLSITKLFASPIQSTASIRMQ